jgi:potassium-dependent mechanosensitive channel
MVVLRQWFGFVTCLFLTGLFASVASGQYSPSELLQPFASPAAEPAAPAVQPRAAESPAPQFGEATATPGATPAAASEPAVAPQPGDQFEFVGLESVQQDLGQSAKAVWALVVDIGKIPLIVGSDAKSPVLTVGTLVGGLFLLGFGYIAAGMISRWTAAKLLTRFGLNKSAVSPLQSITFYLLLSTFTMLSLNILNVPMTVFNFLGGALAIGAGFGSQNIVNNFISGLILLAERPIRVGDVIQLDSWTGTVTQIGARSTKIQNFMNHEIIVPNSKLLETSVVNWTLSDDTVGCILSVGVAYGSPTREVERLLALAAAEHPHVIKEPAPEVMFMDFGADSLVFELRFWVNLRTSRKLEIESDLRYRIEELLSDRGIVIAYPQRDVHLNVLRPVEVRLTQPVASPLSQSRSAA